MDISDKKYIQINEVGPRDGFQIESKFIPTPLKLEMINGLAAAGISQIQVASFVHPKKVPQMADAKRVVAGLTQRDGVSYNALALNLKGVQRAHDCGITDLEIGASASGTHSEKNTGMSFQESLSQSIKMIRTAKKYHMKIRAGIQCSFGCHYEGPIPVTKVLHVARHLFDEGIDRLLLGDTTGMATPPAIAAVLEAILKIPVHTPLGLHLHDTRGVGLVNLMEGLKFDITHFDTSFGGLGGCPFIPGAAGNIATEETIYLLNALNYHTGINIRKVAACSHKMEAFLEKPLAGKMYRSLTFRNGFS
jgi:hydroxymethylglutaryl-CoA lyase